MAFSIAGASLALLALSYALPFHTYGRLANKLLLVHKIDILAMENGIISGRTYHSVYFSYEPFAIEVFQGGMIPAPATDPHQFGPLASQFEGLGFAIGWEERAASYRYDRVHD
jgi:hypothetical protein